MKIAFFSTKGYDRTFFDQYKSTHQITYFEAGLTLDTVPLAAGSNVVCAFVNDHLDAPVLKALNKIGVQLIAMRCAGFNNVSLETANELKMPVVRVPSYSPMAVAEHATALIMALNRKTHKAYNRVRDGNFSLERLTGFDMFGKTVGVVGTGKIGECFCKIMLGFGCRVLAYDVQESAALVAAGVDYVPLDELLGSSDIISLHCPLMEGTFHLIDEKAFALMKSGTMLINTSRGGLIHTEHAVEALKNGILGYLGIDVYEQEELLFFQDLSENIIQDDIIARLISFPNVLITSHQGFLTHEALEEIAKTTIANIDAFETGVPLINQVAAV